MEKRIKISNGKSLICLYALMLLFKAGLEYGYIYHLHILEPNIYPMNPNPLKWIYGCIWLTALFFLIQHGKQLASAFLLHFFIILQMVPITVIYELKDDNTLFYTVICTGVLLCELIVRFGPAWNLNFRNGKIIGRLMIGSFIVLLVLFLAQTYKRNGLPTLTALNLYDVYELRRSGTYQISKWGRYLQATVIKILIPILLVKYVTEHKYKSVVIVLTAEFLIYLYEGQKTFLFTGLMTIGVVWWLSRKNLVDKFWQFFYLTMSFICFFVHNKVALSLFRLFVRRIFLLSANNKFFYYDFFSTHPKEGFAGIFPRWLVPIVSNYEQGFPNGYTYQIGRIYYDSPAMDCNTGFIGEGYLRWGFFGIIVELLLLACILKCVDAFQKKTSYVFAVGVSVPIIFGLTDDYLVGTLLCGYLTVWLAFLFIYKTEHAQNKRRFLICNNCIFKTRINRES